MNRIRDVVRDYFSNAREARDDNPRTATISRRETSMRNKRRYTLYEPTPLTDEEVRQLPVAHQYSA
jgi:hypothetical protein